MIRKGLLAAWLRPKTLVMLGLGFSSGLPFLLTANTFAFWLRDEGTTLTAIGILSWVQWSYALKFFWAPLIDRVPAPLLARLGRRRGWIAFTQLVLACGLAGMALVGTSNLYVIGLLALSVAFASATQDIVVDAWRIEASATQEELGFLVSTYQFGYRAALLVTDSLVLILASHVGWQPAYGFCAAAMAIGLVAVFFAQEPEAADAAMAAKPPLSTTRGLADAVTGPFISFFKTYGWMSLVVLTMISLYRLPDYAMGMMYNPYYHDLGLSKDMVGVTRGTIGLPMSLFGIAAGGAAALKLGKFKTLIIGQLAQSLATASFAILAYTGAHPAIFSAIMAVDAFALSFSGVALVAYLSSLTSLGYTATQYAFLSSTYAYLGKFLKGVAGIYIESLVPHFGLLPSYAVAFLTSGALGIPPLILCIVLMRMERAP